MKKSLKTLIGAILCSAAMLFPMSNIAAMPVQAATTTYASTASQSQTSPFTIRSVRSFQTGKVNFTVDSRCPFNEINSRYNVKTVTGQTINVTGLQVLVRRKNVGWTTPSASSNASDIRKGYIDLRGIKSKSISWCYTEITKNDLADDNYLFVAVVPVNKNGNRITFASSKYYSKSVLFDYYGKRMVNGM